jgi:hypothetical protein
MYTVATFLLGQALRLPFLLTIPQVFVYVALTAWLVLFVLMLWDVVVGHRHE